MRKKVTIKGIETEAWDALKEMREEEQRLFGAIVSEAILDYQSYHYGEAEPGEPDVAV